MTKQQRDWLERFARFGYLAKGVVYLTIGILAGLAAWEGGRPEGSDGALQAILQQPYGKVLLSLVGIGLLGYAAWRLVQGVRDAEHKGNDAGGLAQRGGYVVSGLVHLALAFACANAVLSLGQGGEGNVQSWTATVMSEPFGRWLVGLAGVALIAVGLFRLYTAFTKSFKSRFHLERMSEDERRLAVRAGQFGIAARSVVFGMAGYFLLQAAVKASPGEAGATEDVLTVVAGQGTAYLQVMALGLVAYAVYQAFLARYRHINAQAA